MVTKALLWFRRGIEESGYLLWLSPNLLWKIAFFWWKKIFWSCFCRSGELRASQSWASVRPRFSCQLCGSALPSPATVQIKEVGAAQAARTAGVDWEARCDCCKDAPFTELQWNSCSFLCVWGQLGAVLLVLWSRKRFKRESVPNEHLRQVSPIVHFRKSLAGCPSICLRSRYEHGVGFGVAGLLRAVTRGVLWAFVDALVFTRRFSSPNPLAVLLC